MRQRSVDSKAPGKRPVSRAGALVLGMAVGATAAVLAAPKSGKETRARLAKSGRDSMGRFEQGAAILQEGAAEARKRLSSVRAVGKRSLNKTSKKAGKELKKTIKSARKRLERVAR